MGSSPTTPESQIVLKKLFSTLEGVDVDKLALVCISLDAARPCPALLHQINTVCKTGKYKLTLVLTGLVGRHSCSKLPSWINCSSISHTIISAAGPVGRQKWVLLFIQLLCVCYVAYNCMYCKILDTLYHFLYLSLKVFEFQPWLANSDVWMVVLLVLPHYSLLH